MGIEPIKQTLPYDRREGKTPSIGNVCSIINYHKVLEKGLKPLKSNIRCGRTSLPTHSYMFFITILSEVTHNNILEPSYI